MANNRQKSPWVLDTVDTALSPSFVAITVKHVIWESPAAPGDDFKLTDANGRIIAKGICEVALQSQVFLVEQSFDGAALPVLDSGILYVYTE